MRRENLYVLLLRRAGRWAVDSKKTKPIGQSKWLIAGL